MKQAAKKKEDTAIKAGKEKDYNSEKAKDLSHENEKEEIEDSEEKTTMTHVSGKNTKTEMVCTTYIVRITVALIIFMSVKR